MPYLVDGHNLIPHVRGIELSALDDELQLIDVLQGFCRSQRRQVEVYFDNAPPGSVGTRSHGAVKAHFVRQGKTADDAIQDRLVRLGKAARNWIVVSSDHAVQASARSAQASVLTSPQFAAQIASSPRTPRPDPGQQAEPPLNPDEIDNWLKIFNAKRDG